VSDQRARRRSQHIVGPQDDLAVPGSFREPDALVDQLSPNAQTATLESGGYQRGRALEEVRKHAKPGEFDRVAAHVRNLREWFRTFVLENRGKPLKAAALADLAPLNRTQFELNAPASTLAN
jgi:hypothetical protein